VLIWSSYSERFVWVWLGRKHPAGVLFAAKVIMLWCLSIL
jgi:hypothetical protein